VTKIFKSRLLRNYRWVWWLVFSPFIMLSVLVVMAKLGWLGEMPDIREIEDPKRNEASVIYTDDGKILGKYFLENRTIVDYENISPNVINALIPTEDVRFYEHSGIDPRGTLRAFTYLGSEGGASTITQQLAKLLFHKKPKGRIPRLIQKIKEWVIALELERNFTKKEILTMYLNQADFGHNIYGIHSAAKVYFNKSPKDLTVPEAALIVGLLKGPSMYSPWTCFQKGKMQRAINRRNTVLNQMEKYGKITKAQNKEFKKTDLVPNMQELKSRIMANAFGGGNTHYFLEELKKDVDVWCKKSYNPRTKKPYNIYTDGLKIYTTIDSRMQKYAEQSIRDHMKKLQADFFKIKKGKKNGPFSSDLSTKEVEKIIMQGLKNTDNFREMKEKGISESEILKDIKEPRKMTIFTWIGPRDTTMSPWDSVIHTKTFLMSGLMCMDPHSGKVKAWVGGIDYSYFKYDHVRAGKYDGDKKKIMPDGGRQVGSTFKPFVYTLAMREGRSPCEEVPNVQVCVDNWCPASSSYKANQTVSLKEALAQSLNWISAMLIKQYGTAAVIKLAQELGITAKLENNPSICLGTPDISVYEMTAAFSTFFNKGIYNEPIFLSRIEDKNGNILADFTNESREVLSEQTAALTVELMSGVATIGTGTKLRTEYKFTEPMAGKTGTTQNASDGWFIGGTPDLVCAVWTGAEDRTVRNSSWTGARMSLPTWGMFMRKVYNDRSIKLNRGEFEMPADMTVPIDCSTIPQEEAPVDYEN
jgi:penicillin-binding protein 1A